MAQRLAVRRSLRIGTPPTTAAALPSRSLTTRYNPTIHNNHTASTDTIRFIYGHTHGHWNYRTNTVTNTQRSFTIRATPLKPQEEPTPSQNDQDECPEWNNPILHQKGPTKIMLSDYSPNDNNDAPSPPIVPLPPMDLHNDGKVLAPPHLHAIAREIVSLNMLEVKELVDRVADHFQIIDDGGSNSGGGSGGGSSEGNEEGSEEDTPTEQTVFEVKLTGFDPKSKIKVIKEVRTITALGLKEAKALVDGVPKVLKEGLKKEDAEELKKTLEGIGATVEIV